MTSWHGIIFKEFQRFWENLRNFSYFNRSFVEFCFILLYALEQVVLILITFQIQNLALLSLLISLFALGVLTTFAIHKLVMESRIKILEGKVQNLQQAKASLEEKTHEIAQNYEEIYRVLGSEGLNSLKISSSKKGDNHV